VGCAVIGQLRERVAVNAFFHPILEMPCIGGWTSVTAIAQVVRQVARADDQHVFRSERGKRSADVEMMLRAKCSLHRDLHHRHVRLRIHIKQRGPGAMIKPALRVCRCVQPGLL